MSVPDVKPRQADSMPLIMYGRTSLSILASLGLTNLQLLQARWMQMDADGCRWMQDILILLASLVGMTWGFRKFDPHRTFMDSTSYCSWTLQFQTCGGPSLAKPFSLSQSRIRLRCPISRTVSRFATCQILLAVVFLLHAADGAMLPGIFKAGSADVCSQQGIHVVH